MAAVGPADGPRTARAGIARDTVMGASPTSRSPVVRAIQRLTLRTAGTPLRSLTARVYSGTARAVTAYLTRGAADAAAYVRGGVATNDYLPGVSDVDTTLVFAQDGPAAELARRRWLRLARALPITELLVETPMVYDEAGLHELAGESALTYGLDRPASPRRAGYFGTHATFDRLRTLERPGLYGLGADWRLLRGPDRRPSRREQDAQARRIASWLELVYWWRLAFPACVQPAGPRTAALCMKLVAEPVRIWVWLAHGERASGRADALRHGMRRLPEEEPALRRALALHDELHRSPEPPLEDALRTLVRISGRIAERIEAETRDVYVTEVALAGADAADAPAGVLPLADWRALVCPAGADEYFAPQPGDPGDPAVVAAAASRSTGPHPVVRAGGLMLLPGAPWWRTRLRAVQCGVTDPVSFALAGGERVARFPDLRGWSAADVARRGVAEHGAWLRGEPRAPTGPTPLEGSGHALGMLFTAARAALLHESVAARSPELALTAAETARRVAERSPAARTVVEDALGHHREFAAHDRPPSARVVAAMREIVLRLPAYAGS